MGDDGTGGDVVHDRNLRFLVEPLRGQGDTRYD